MCHVGKDVSQGETSRMALSSLTMGPSAGVAFFPGSFGGLQNWVGDFLIGDSLSSQVFIGQGPVWMNQPSEGGTVVQAGLLLSPGNQLGPQL